MWPFLSSPAGWIPANMQRRSQIVWVKEGRSPCSLHPLLNALLFLTWLCHFIVSHIPDFSPTQLCFTALALQAAGRRKKNTVWLKLLSGWSNHLLRWIHVCVSSKWSKAALQLEGWCVCPHKIFIGGSFSRTFWQLYAWKYIHHLSPAPRCQNV